MVKNKQRKTNTACPLLRPTPPHGGSLNKSPLMSTCFCVFMTAACVAACQLMLVGLLRQRADSQLTSASFSATRLPIRRPEVWIRPPPHPPFQAGRLHSRAAQGSPLEYLEQKRRGVGQRCWRLQSLCSIGIRRV